MDRTSYRIRFPHFVRKVDFKQVKWTGAQANVSLKQKIDLMNEVVNEDE